MYISRNIETHLVQSLERNETMVLVGPRQAGNINSSARATLKYRSGQRVFSTPNQTTSRSSI